MDYVQGGSGGFGLTKYDGPPVFMWDDPFLLTLSSEGGSTRTTASPYTLPKFYIVNAVEGIPFARDVGRRSAGGKKDGKFPSSHSFALCFDSLHFVLSRFVLLHCILLRFFSFRFIAFRFVSSCFVSLHFVSSRFVLFPFISFSFVSSCLISFRFAPLCFVCFVLFLFATREHSLRSQASLFFIPLESALSPSLTLSLSFPICFVFFSLSFFLSDFKTEADMVCWV